MKMVFTLRKLGSRDRIEITKTEFESLKVAKHSYALIIQIEENFDAVMEDYVELEETLLHFGIRYLAFHSFDHFQFQTMRTVINRRVLHLLSTARLYRGALLKSGKALLKNSGQSHRLESELNDSPRQPMAFRIVEALRNYSQHNDFPISSMTTTSRREREDDLNIEDRSAYFITAKIDACEIARERKLPTDVKDALLKLGTNAEIIGIIRKYIEHLGSIHSIFRDLAKEQEEQSLMVMRDGITRCWMTSAPEGAPRLVIAMSKNDNEISEEVQIFDDFFESLRRLRIKNGTQANLSKRYVRWSGAQ